MDIILYYLEFDKSLAAPIIWDINQHEVNLYIPIDDKLQIT